LSIPSNSGNIVPTLSNGDRTILPLTIFAMKVSMNETLGCICDKNACEGIRKKKITLPPSTKFMDK
jgi:hypothetical protein